MDAETVNYFDGRITVDPAICNGKPTIRGKRIAVQTILEYLGAGESEEEILNQYPSLQADDIKTCLQFASGLIPSLTPSPSPACCRGTERYRLIGL